MHLPDAVTIVITRPLFAAVADSMAGSAKAFVAAPFVGIDCCGGACEAVNVGKEVFLVGMFDNSQPYLSGFSSHGAYHRGRSLS